MTLGWRVLQQALQRAPEGFNRVFPRGSIVRGFQSFGDGSRGFSILGVIWVVVKIMVPFWVP